jgi:hypothetical protein
MTLNTSPATTGFASHDTTRYARPSPTSTRAIHVGVAMSTSGATK